MSESDHCPVRAQLGPYIVDVEEGRTYFWCSCGRSQKQPYCDGRHAGTPFKPVEFTAELTGKMFLCGCKESCIKPLCDNTHSKLGGYREGKI